MNLETPSPDKGSLVNQGGTTPLDPKSSMSTIPSESLAMLGQTLPKLMLTILNGGKEVGSKVKFSKFYLLIEITIGDILKAE